MEHPLTAIAGQEIYIPSDSLGNVPFDEHIHNAEEVIGTVANDGASS